MRKCKVCGEKFEPKFTSFQKTCDRAECMVAFGRQEREKQWNREVRKKQKARRENDRSWWIKQADKEFNRWIRLRDAGRGCISCGGTNCQFHAGHYRPKGRNAALRYEPDNVHSQCAQCNNNHSGNLTQYRLALIEKIGQERVEWLEKEHGNKRWEIEELKEIRDKYRRLIKEAEQ